VQQLLPLPRIPLAGINENVALKRRNIDHFAADLKRLKAENTRLSERLARPQIF